MTTGGVASRDEVRPPPCRLPPWDCGRIASVPWAFLSRLAQTGPDVHAEGRHEGYISAKGSVNASFGYDLMRRLGRECFCDVLRVTQSESGKGQA